MTSNKLIIFSAPSGSGKTTIVRHLLETFSNQLEFSISATSRPQRGVEENGKDYHYLSVEEFKQKIDANEFLEWEEVYAGTHYGTLKSEVERIWAKGKQVIFDIDVEGGLNLKKVFGEIGELKRTRMQFEANLRAMVQAHLSLIDQGQQFMPKMSLPPELDMK